MKKIFSIVLALMLMLVPVTAFATDASDVEVGYGDRYLEVGTGDYTMSADYEYTVFTLEPTEVGKFVVSVENAYLGIVSYNGMWMTIVPDSETISATSVEWDCSSVGQSIWVAVKSENATVSITVEKKDLNIKEVEKFIYDNTVTPEAFTFDGDADALLYVDTEDSVVDEAVLGTDGLYHLNSVDGPVLYANLNDSLMSLADAVGYGQLKYVEYENGEAVSVTDYNEAFLEYSACADANTMLYPLTADLIEIFQMVGANLNWYGDGGWVGGTEEDAWMFACYYNENGSASNPGGSVTPGDSTTASGNAGNNTPVTTVPGDDSAANNDGAETTAPTTDDPVKSPQTGDSMMMVAAMAMIALAACVTVVIKRRTTK